jgi:hypothetical protein
MAEGMSFEGTKFLPYCFGHDACRCTFIDDTPMNCDVPYFYWYLKSDQGGKTRFFVVKIKGDESGICRVDCPQGGK